MRGNKLQELECGLANRTRTAAKQLFEDGVLVGNGVSCKAGRSGNLGQDAFDDSLHGLHQKGNRESP
jgi:hypothetical protein